VWPLLAVLALAIALLLLRASSAQRPLGRRPVAAAAIYTTAGEHDDVDALLSSRTRTGAFQVAGV
jgi:hypothetical protein